MTPATAERPKTKKAKKVRFEAPGTGAVSTMESQHEVINTRGVKVPLPGTGKRIVFNEDGYGGQFYETTDETEIAWLRERAAKFGVFTEVPIPAPDPNPVLKQIVKLLSKGDIAGLEALAQEEDDTWERPDVMEAIADAVEALRG